MNMECPEKTWQELYRAALFETDKTKTVERIAEAERVIVARARSLFHDRNSAWAEHNALDAAFYALNVLKFYASGQKNASNQPALPVLGSSAWNDGQPTQKVQSSRVYP